MRVIYENCLSETYSFLLPNFMNLCVTSLMWDQISNGVELEVVICRNT